VLDPVALGRILDEVLPAPHRGLKDLQIRVLRYHPRKRCVFETAGRSPDGPRSWIGKVYAVDRADVYHAMEAIRQAGFGPDAEFSIPEPVAYLPESRLLLQEKVAGRSATDLFLSEDVNDRLRMSERCAGWLARFHAVAPRSGPIFDLNDYQLDIEHWSHRIAGVGGAFADKAGELRRQLEVAVSRIRDHGTCPSHGSLSHHQVIAANGRTVTFDWDHHAVADPAFDVARFLVYLRRLAFRCLGSVWALDAAADVFLNTYLSECGREVRGNLPFYAAAICLRLAKKDIRHQADRWAEKAVATLDEGLRFLERGV
jgi:aminoglycoside phosphotransferase (APT) family kinase protein